MAESADELLELHTAYQLAVAYIATKAYAEAFKAWAEVVPMTGRLIKSLATFSRKAKGIVRKYRKQTQAVSWSYLRVKRALHTGYTIPPLAAPGGPGPIRILEPASTPIPLNQLRTEFVEIVKKYAPPTLRAPVIPDMVPDDGIEDEVEISTPSGHKYRPYRQARWADERDVMEEYLSRLEKEIQERDDAIEAELNDLFDRLAKERTGAVVTGELLSDEERLEERMRVLGREFSNHADRMTQNGARGTAIGLGRADGRALGWTRVHVPHNGDNPCGFCALLLSQGFVYKSKKGAELSWSQFAEFHSTCHCHAEPVYAKGDYKDAMFDPNREYRAMWDEHFKGQYATPAKAISEWRKFIRNLNTTRSRAPEPAPQEGTDE